MAELEHIVIFITEDNLITFDIVFMAIEDYNSCLNETILSIEKFISITHKYNIAYLFQNNINNQNNNNHFFWIPYKDVLGDASFFIHFFYSYKSHILESQKLEYDKHLRIKEKVEFLRKLKGSRLTKEDRLERVNLRKERFDNGPIIFNPTQMQINRKRDIEPKDTILDRFNSKDDYERKHSNTITQYIKNNKNDANQEDNTISVISTIKSNMITFPIDTTSTSTAPIQNNSSYTNFLLSANNDSSKNIQIDLKSSPVLLSDYTSPVDTNYYHYFKHINDNNDSDTNTGDDSDELSYLKENKKVIDTNLNNSPIFTTKSNYINNTIKIAYNKDTSKHLNLQYEMKKNSLFTSKINIKYSYIRCQIELEKRYDYAKANRKLYYMHADIEY